MTRKIISILLVASMLLTMTFGSFISKAADVIPEGYKSFDVSVNFDVYPTDTQHDPSNYKVYIFPDYFEAAESTDEVAFFISENYTFFFDMFNFEPFEVPELTYQSNASNGVMLADTSVVRPETENPAGKFMVVFYNDNGELRLAVKQNGTLETDYNYEEGSFTWYSLSETSIKLKKYVDDNTYSHYVQDNKSSQSRTYFVKYSCDKDGNVIKENQFHESGEVLYKQVINVYEDGSLVESYSLSCNGYKYLNNLDKQHTEYSYNNGATKVTTYNFDFATKKYVFGNCVETNTITDGNITEESTVYYVDDIIQNSSYKTVTTYGEFGKLKEVKYTYDNEWVATYQKAYTYNERGWYSSIITSEILSDGSLDDYDFIYYTINGNVENAKEYTYNQGTLYMKWDCDYTYDENDECIRELVKYYYPSGLSYAYTYDYEYDENGNLIKTDCYRYSDEDLQDMYYYYNEYSIYDGDVLLSKTYSNGYYSYGDFVEYKGTVEYSYYKNVKNSLEIYDVYIDGVFLKTIREEYIYYSGITVGNDAFRNMQTSVSKVLSMPCPNESAENPTIIILTSDIEESIVIPEGRYVVIDLNGFSINAPKNKTAISVHGSTLFLINEKESGGIFATNGKKQTACLGVKDDGDIIIDGVTLVGKTLLELKNQTKDVIVLNGFISGSFAHVAEQPVCFKVYNCKSDFDLTPYLADNVYLVDDGSSSGVYESLFVTYKVQRELIAKLNAMGEDFDNVIRNAIKDLEMYNLRPMRDIEKDTSELYKIFRKACSDLQKARVEALKEKAEELKTDVDQIRAEDGNSTLIKICQFVAKSTRGVVLESLNNHWNFIVSFIKGFFKIA